jgi:hypothetical protein
MGDSISMFTQHHGPIGDGIALLTGLCFCSWLLICEFSKRKPPAGRQLLWVGIVTACIDSRMQAQACSRPSVVISGLSFVGRPYSLFCLHCLMECRYRLV